MPQSYKNNPKKANSRKVAIETWIRQHVSAFDHAPGERDPKTGKIRPKYQVGEADVLRHFQNRRAFGLGGLTNELLGRHVTGYQIRYASGNSYKYSHTLFCIDIDCHGRGSVEGAKRFLRYVEQRLKVQFFFELSTNKTGIHAYARLARNGESAAGINSALRTLENWLCRACEFGQPNGQPWDISGVEIAGTCSVLQWSEGAVVGYKAGRLMKLPMTYKDNDQREQELRDTAEFTIAQLEALHRHILPNHVVGLRPSNKVVGLTISGGSATSDGKDQPLCRTLKREGSFSGHVIPRKEIERLTSTYFALAKRIMPESIPAGGRQVASTEDLAILLMILASFTDKMGADKAMPSRRIAENWRVLKDEGIVSRSYQDTRVAALRNYLSDLGYIEWQDENYWNADKPGFSPQNLTGVACKYCLANKLMIELGFREVKKTLQISPRGNTALTSSHESTNTPDIAPANIPQALELPTVDATPPIIRPRRIGWATEYFGVA